MQNKEYRHDLFLTTRPECQVSYSVSIRFGDKIVDGGGAVAAASGDEATVVGHGEAADDGLIEPPFVLTVAGGPVPQDDLAAVASGKDHLRIGQEQHLLHNALDSFQARDGGLVISGCIPDTDRLV